MLKKLLYKFSQSKFSAIYVLIALGSLLWSLTMVKSGICMSLDCPDGRSFWGPNGHDGIWHISLSESFSRGSWSMPVFSPEEVKNYHVGFDLLLSFVHKLTNLSTLILYFQIFPVVLSLLIGIFVYKFMYSWTVSVAKTFWGLFFVYFGGGFGYFITLINDGTVGGESVFWSQQSISTLVNPPYALSLVIIFAALYLLNEGLVKSEKKYLVVASLMFGSLIQIKVYAGILALSGLLAASVVQMFQRRGLSIFKVFLSSSIISVLLFPGLAGSSGNLVFKPFWYLETMMQLTDRVGWQKFGEAMVNYRSGRDYLKFIPSYLVAFVIFIVGNMGTRFISLLLFWKYTVKTNKPNVIGVFAFTVILAGIILPTIYLQKGTPWNTIQFIYYSLTFSGILAGIFLGRIWETVKLGKVVAGLVVLLTLPTTYGTLRYVYLPKRPPAYVPKPELEALHFLADRPSGVVLTFPFDRIKANEARENPPRPLYLYESTAYVSALSRKDVFLEDEVNLDITGYDWRERRKEVENWYKENDPDKAKEFLRRNNITYIYWVKESYDDISQRALLGDFQLGLTNIYENNKVVIYQTQ